jgi:glycosyltransferase involved in cell wall biosynthesis
MTAALGSVVIPAHNEQAVILSGLDALFEGFADGELDVVVVCNGCTDGTADLARSSRYPVTVVELQAASKPAALREGDRRATVFPRIYLDADVSMPGSSARAVLERLRSPPAQAARPPLVYDSTGASAVVRSYYRARSRLPTVMTALWGAGVYGLSAAGRGRFAEFPDLQADDLFVDQQFGVGDIEIVPCPPVVVHTPQRARHLRAVLRRTYRGKSAARESTSAERPDTMSSSFRDLARSAGSSPRTAADAIVYAAFSVIGRLGRRRAGNHRWERDDSSRRPPER